jgi:LysR family glycine cleavage system transcriptional activator
MRRGKGELDWSSVRLLHEVTYDYWPDWISHFGRTDVDVARGLFFSHTMLALDAAVEGQGVALAPAPLADRELARGALEVVDPRPFVPGTGFWLCWPRRQLRTLSKAATAFRDWVIEEARATPHFDPHPPARRKPPPSVPRRRRPS